MIDLPSCAAVQQAAGADGAPGPACARPGAPQHTGEPLGRQTEDRRSRWAGGRMAGNGFA
jgi:hypothetical protein